jgi:hypothetical protein
MERNDKWLPATVKRNPDGIGERNFRTAHKSLSHRRFSAQLLSMPTPFRTKRILCRILHTSIAVLAGASSVHAARSPGPGSALMTVSAPPRTGVPRRLRWARFSDVCRHHPADPASDDRPRESLPSPSKIPLVPSRSVGLGFTRSTRAGGHHSSANTETINNALVLAEHKVERQLWQFWCLTGVDQ